jgi:membrane-bound lytic murein transglycosylase D
MIETPARLPWVVRVAIAAIVLSASAVQPTTAQQRTGTTPTPAPAQQRPTTKTVFPDEFSDLDDAASDSTSAFLDDGVIEQLEFARKRYLTALTAIEKKDTAEAARQFERAIQILNDLASYPRIDENPDFADLAQSIVEDYENYIRNIDDLDETASAYVLRERIFEEIQASKNTVEALTVPKVSAPRTIPQSAIPLVVNEAVETELAFLTSDRAKKFLKRWIERTGRWFDMFKRIAREEGVPEEIAHLSMIESGLDPDAVSRVKAVGMWQFMQPTGRDYGLDVTFWQDERRDPEKATRAAMRYLKDLYNDFGDWHLTLAAYNFGWGNVKRTIRRSGLANPSFWDITGLLPRETRRYVPLFIATTLVTTNREQYGFGDDSVTIQQPYDYDVVTIAEPCNLAALASCLNLQPKDIRALNPELVRHCTPPTPGGYALKIPKGASDDFSRRFALLNDDEKRPWMNHTVARGETLASIAKRYGVGTDDIANANNIRGYRAKLRRGMSLRVPVGSQTSALASAPAPSSSSVAAQATTTQAANTSTIQANQQPAQVAVAVPASVSPSASVAAAQQKLVVAGSRTSVHVIQSGDNLSSIARRYGVRVTDIRNWNDIPFDRDGLSVGDTLIVGIKDAAQATTIASVERLKVTRTVQHQVVRGESIASIAALYGTTPDRLLQLNGMKPTSTLKAGGTITVETELGKTELAAIQRSAPTGKPVVHKVRRGESLSGIAAIYGVDEQSLLRWNDDVVQGSTVFAGTKLKVYSAQTQKGSSAASTAKRPPKTYKVRKGDTISGIAEKFGVSVDMLRSKNRSLKASNALRAGQTIRLQ